MELQFDFERMEHLLKSFYAISGVRYTLLDDMGKIICYSSDHERFCEKMNSFPEGHARCVKCDANAIANASKAKGECVSYRCHAGLLEACIPVTQHGQTMAYILFGQMADKENRELNWLKTRELISWMDNPDEMYELYMELKQMDAAAMEGCKHILMACSSYIYFQGVLKNASMSDEQRLNSYIQEHYAEPLTLDRIAAAISVSKTALCGIAAKQGTTVMTMVADKRIDEAKRLLRNNDDRISEVAYLVGIRDYNYFTKVFKAREGITPKAYQKQHQKRTAKHSKKHENEE